MLELLSRALNRAAEWVMAVLLLAMTLLVGAQIAGRFLFVYSLFWSDELARFLLVWIAFLGMSVGVHRGAHPGVDSLVRILPPPWRRAAGMLAAACCLLDSLHRHTRKPDVPDHPCGILVSRPARWKPGDAPKPGKP